LNVLLKQAAGQRLLASLREPLASALSLSPEALKFLDLGESDEIRERAAKTFPPRPGLERNQVDFPFRSTQVSPISELSNLLPQATADVFLVLPEAHRVGVLRLPMTIVNQRLAQVLGIRPDGFLLIDVEFSNQAVLQVVEDEPRAARAIDIAAWGELWARALENYRAHHR
jgi:hypothetical protein